MNSIDSAIFRKNDIRGIAAGDNPPLNPYVARMIGMAVGTYLPRQFDTERFFVGCDNRLTSRPLKSALIEGLIDTGNHVTDISEVLTPTVYFASAKYGSRGAGIMITGSHLPVEHNGFKIVYGHLALAGQQIEDLLNIIMSKGFNISTVSGTLDYDHSLLDKHLNTISSLVTIKKPLRIILDAGNGLSGSFIPPLLRKLGIQVDCLYCESDGNFPNHLPNPEEQDYMKDLIRKVTETNADLGLAFDGDADRCGLVDEKGNLLYGDRILWLIAADLLQRQPGSKIILDIKSSQVVFNSIKELGGVPIMWKTGHSLTIAKMQEEKALLAGDVHGHIFFGENYYGFDDGPLTALRILEIISKSEQSVSELFARLPNVVTSPEIILPTPDSFKFEIVDEIREKLKQNYRVIETDGARVLFDELGWGLVRCSNSQAAITLRFEGLTEAHIAKYVRTMMELLSGYPAVETDRLAKYYSYLGGGIN